MPFVTLLVCEGKRRDSSYVVVDCALPVVSNSRGGRFKLPANSCRQ